METILTMPWPIQPNVEKTFLMRCRELVASGEQHIYIKCTAPHPSIQVLTLLLDIARLAPHGKTQWYVMDAEDNLLEALRLTGLDFCFKTCADGEAVV